MECKSSGTDAPPFLQRRTGSMQELVMLKTMFEQQRPKVAEKKAPSGEEVEFIMPFSFLTQGTFRYALSPAIGEKF